jgi:hypothetical protein
MTDKDIMIILVLSLKLVHVLDDDSHLSRILLTSEVMEVVNSEDLRECSLEVKDVRSKEEVKLLRVLGLSEQMVHQDSPIGFWKDLSKAALKQWPSVLTNSEGTG